MSRIDCNSFGDLSDNDTDRFVVAVEVEMVIPVDDPSEPCYESETVQLLRETKQHAEQGDVAWLTKAGKVYAAMQPV